MWDPIPIFDKYNSTDLSQWLMYFSGWVVPLVIVFLVLCKWPRTVNVRRILAAIIMAGVGASWLFFATQPNVPGEQPLVPLIGHYIWTTGILIMLGSEIVAICKVKRAGDPPFVT